MTTGRINQIAIHAARDQFSSVSSAFPSRPHSPKGARPELVRCVFALQSFYQSGSWRRLLFQEPINTPHATALVPALDAPFTDRPAAAQARALIVDRSLCLRVPQLLYRVTFRTDVYVTSAKASRPTPIGSDSE